MAKESNNYISLQEAAKHCSYSQEYLSLRARQGKLRATKLGRNWVTTKKWLKEYLNGVEEYNNLKDKKIKPVRPVARPVRRIPSQARKEVSAPENLPIGEFKLAEVRPLHFRVKEALLVPTVRLGFVFAIVLVLIIAGGILSRTSLQYVFENVENELSKIETKIAEDEIYSATISNTINVFKEYSQWLDNIARDQISKIKNSSPIIVTGKVLKPIWQGAKNGYITINNFIEDKLSILAETVSKFCQRLGNALKAIARFFSQPFKTIYQFVIEEKAKPEIPKDIASDIQSLKQQIKQLKEQGIVVKELIKEIEVSKVTRIEPIKEITREIIKIDDEALAQLLSWEADIENFKAITQKLQANPTYTSAPTAPIYIASQGLQVAGSGNFTSLGVSGPLGAKDLGVGGSATLGSDSSDILNVKATSTFFSPVTAKTGLTVGTGTDTLTINSLGNLTTTGKITTGTFQMTSSSTSGYVLASDALGNATWTDVSSAIGPWTLSGSNLYPDDAAYNVAIGADSPVAKLTVAGNMAVGSGYATSTAPTDGLIVQGNVGIGTATPNQALDLIGSLELESTTNSTAGVIYKGTDRFIHDFHHPTGGGAVPSGYNLFIGKDAGNFTMGSTAAEIWEGSYNLGIGQKTLESVTTGYFSTAIGYAALNSMTTGFDNFALGSNALKELTTGAANVGIGSGTLRYNHGGSANVAIGYWAGLGSVASTNYSYNIFIGYQAGNSVTTGSNNIIIGYDADMTTGDANYELNIGNTIYGDLSTGNVGIGTTSPRGNLDIAGIDPTLRLTNLGTGNYDFVIEPRGKILNLSSAAGTQIMAFKQNGNVGIGTTEPDATLDVDGTVSIFGDWTTTDSLGNTLVKEAVYKATTDGFVSAYQKGEYSHLRGFTDGSNPPGTLRQWSADAGWADDNQTFNMPVRKGDYWKVTATYKPIIYWLPIGSGTCVRQ